MLCALIMAGGRGERFWPLSTDEKPKQFLKLLGEQTMIQMTVNRLEGLIPIDRIFVVTGKAYVRLVREQLPELPLENIIVEPVGKNTAPCIALSAFVIEEKFQNSTMVVLPSDHLISDEKNFREVIDSGYKYIEKNNEAIVTIGMKPTRPDTGYGYIKYGAVSEQINGSEIREVERFVEKPSLVKAEEYLAEGNFLWNGGMFIWKTNNVLKLTEAFLNDTYTILREIAASAKEEFYSVLERRYSEVESISVDYGIMEKAKSIQVIPGNFGWDDVGSWHSVERVREKDENCNITVGNVKITSSLNNIVFGKDKPIILAGVDNLFIIESDESIFIGSKDVIKDIKEIKTMFQK